MVDIAAFIKAWRSACIERGVDPVEGATGFQVASLRAEQSKAMHNQHMAEMVMRHAVRHAILWDNGYGMIDRVKVERQQSRLWHVYLGYWPRLRGDDAVVSRPTEIQALRNIRADVEYRLGHEPEEVAIERRRVQRAVYTKTLFREVVREVLCEEKANAWALSIG
jgi:hypothetical protein